MEIYIVSNFSHINNIACLFLDMCNCFFRIATRNGIDYLKLCFGPGLIVSQASSQNDVTQKLDMGNLCFRKSGRVFPSSSESPRGSLLLPLLITPCPHLILSHFGMDSSTIEIFDIQCSQYQWSPIHCRQTDWMLHPVHPGIACYGTGQ